MTGNGHIPLEELALHALQALSERESAEVRAHVAVCSSCRDQLAEFSGDVALVGLSVPQHPVPAGARQRFLNRIAADASSATHTPTPQASRKVSPFFRGAWIPWAMAAALAIVAVLLGVENKALNNELHRTSGQVADLKVESLQARQVIDVLESKSAQRVLLTASKTSIEPTGRVVYEASTGGLVFQASNLKLLASDKTYELWVIPVNGKPIPAGLFRPDAAGSASVIMPPLPKGVPAKAFGVTIERAEGSEAPTAPIIISGAAASTVGE